MTAVSGRVLLWSAVATVLLTAGSLVTVGLLTATDPSSARLGQPCAGPTSTSGTVVNATLVNRGMRRAPMAGGMGAGAMRLISDRATVQAGRVTFVATNTGTVSHELVILPLPRGELAGSRQIGDDGTVNESASVGEASSSCAEGSGEGILPGAIGWVTVTLRPGRYEIICNLPGHYEAGMYAQITVT
ncbi:sulfocyanin-like copper-binding protein [Lacisediminihabitans sp.]|uniref:sulfocyanin-like copper-binding protein n=1 Tax=Lacisediminihabitans sp. TaxID=2787631 RepID=UPI00374DEB1E